MIPEGTAPPRAGGLASIDAAFAAVRSEGRAALMPYMMGGFPDPASARSIAEAYVEGGADLIELGVPFSDPLADGPVIHDAATRAIAAGSTLDGVLELCGEVSGRVPVVLMIYANMALSGGAAEFARRLCDAGAAGAIVPDLPFGEGADVGAALAERGLALVPLVAPTTLPDRRRAICSEAQGFVYVVSTTGVTGERGEVPGGLADLVESVRAEGEVPAAVGFGIGTPEQAAAVGRIADGVIIGSRLVREAHEGGPEGVLRFLEACREGLAKDA